MEGLGYLGVWGALLRQPLAPRVPSILSTLTPQVCIPGAHAVSPYGPRVLVLLTAGQPLPPTPPSWLGREGTG